MEESKFVSTQNDFVMPICNKCIHHIEGDKCKAFDHIPLDILTNIDYHSEVKEGQNGDFVFEPDNNIPVVEDIIEE